MDAQNRQDLIAEHLAAIRELEAQSGAEKKGKAWPPDGFYLLWHVVIGLMLGALGAVVSLTANVLGAPLFGRHPLELIRVYLTFPMGARALEVADGALLTIGCVLYLSTGALVGILFHLGWTVWLAKASRRKKLAMVTGAGLVLWIVSFYLILSWLQPLLLGDNWIVRLVPPWVGALTHLAFVWTIGAGEVWGRFEAYRASPS